VDRSHTILIVAKNSEKLMKSVKLASEEFDAAELRAATTVEPGAAPLDDRQFAKFQRRVAIAPDQLLRYYHRDHIVLDRDNNEEDGDKNDKNDVEPLWIALNDNDANVVSDCENCGSKRSLEFQVKEFFCISPLFFADYQSIIGDASIFILCQ
jgi:hypothetical protein